MSSAPFSPQDYINKRELLTLFYHYVKESLERQYAPCPHVLRSYMVGEGAPKWETILTRYLDAHRYEDLISRAEVRQLAYDWVDEARVGDAINAISASVFCFSVGLSAAKHGNSKMFYA